MSSCSFVKPTKPNEDTAKMTTLTNAEINTKYMMNGRSLFAEALPELATLHREHRRFLESQKLQPYADLLYAHIKERIRPSSMLLELKEQLRGASDLRNVSLPLGFSFNAVQWHQSLEEKKRTQGTMESWVAERETRRTIQTNGWDAKLGTKTWWNRDNVCWDPDYPEDNYDWELFPVRVHRIFKHTDLLERINVLFGSQFEVKLVCTPPHLYTREDADGFTVNRYDLRVYYLGRDLPPRKMSELLAVAQKYEAHVSYSLKPTEEVSFE